MRPLHSFLPDALAPIIRKAPLSPEKVEFAWRTSVGPAVARVTSVHLDSHILCVRTRDAVWQREVERSAGLIRARLEHLLGPGVVRELDVTVE